MRPPTPHRPFPAIARALLGLAMAAAQGCALQGAADAADAPDTPDTPAGPQASVSTAAADAAWRARLEHWPPVDALLLGEQHDADAHQRWQLDTVRWLAARGRLAAVVIEMADAGRGTDGLPPDASAAQVRAALQWRDDAWPWQRYAPAVMAAVAAGVPVRGGNLPPGRMREAMQDAALEARLPPAALALQRQAVADGHCGLVPEPRLAPMVRVQLARDASMAQAVAHAVEQARQGGKSDESSESRESRRTVLLIAGRGHVRRDLGVPAWLPAGFKSKVAIAQAGQGLTAIESEADHIHPTPALAPQDYCAALRAQPPGAQRD